MRPGFLDSPAFWVRAVTVVVVASVGVSLAHLTWRLVGWDDGRDEIRTPDRLTPVGGGASGGVASILALAPFGGGVDANGLPASSLGLVLKGVIYSQLPEESSALIAAGAGPSQNYGIGQTVTGAAVIEAIELDRVILNVGGRRETLAFPRVASAGTAPAGGVAGGLGVSPAASASSPSPAASGLDPDALAALQAASPIASALAEKARTGGAAQPRATQPQAPNPAAAVASAGLSATSEGYRVGPDPPQQLLRAGLQPGDLIRSLNGRPVGDLTSDQQLFERAVSAGSARVEIVRDGRTLTLTFPLR